MPPMPLTPEQLSDFKESWLTAIREGNDENSPNSSHIFKEKYDRIVNVLKAGTEGPETTKDEANDARKTHPVWYSKYRIISITHR